MQLTFQQSEATAARRQFYLHLVDATDGITPETGEAGGQPQYSKNGAAFGNTSATLTSVGNGLYYVTLTTGELDTLGSIAVRYKSAATAEAQDIARVVAGDPYTAWAEAGDAMDLVAGAVDSTSIADNAITNAKIAANAIDTAEIANGAFTQQKFATGAIGPDQIAADAIGSSEFATSAANKIRDVILSDSTPFAGADIASIKSQGEALQFVNGVWLDTANGSAGTTYPTGERATPVDNLTDAKTIADANNIRTIHVAGTVALSTTDYSGYRFVGHGSDLAVFNAGGGTYTNTVFIGGQLTGDFNNSAISAEFCTVNAPTKIGGFVRNSLLIGNVGFGTADVVLDSCRSAVAGGGTPTLDYVSNTIAVSIRAYSGGVTFANVVTGSSTTIELVAGNVILAASCTGGDFHVRGIAGYTNNGTITPTIEALLSDSEIADIPGIRTDTEDIQSRLPASITGAGLMRSDVEAISGDGPAADNMELDYDGNGYAKTTSTIGNVVTLVGHTPQTGDNYARLGAPAGVSVSADIAENQADLDTLLARVTASIFSGITSLAEWLGALAGKQVANATAITEIQATGAGSGTYDEALESQEAIRDRLDTLVGTPAADVSADIAAVKADTANIETDTQDIQGRLPATLAGGLMRSDVEAVSGDGPAADNMELDYDGTGYNKSASTIGTATDVTNQVSADMTAISGDTAAADNLEALMDGVIIASVDDAGFSPTTTQFDADGFTEATDDHFIGRLVTFVGGVLNAQQSDITDYDGANQRFTVTALTEAPANNQQFVIH